MWRLISIIAAVTSFASVLFFWSKRKQLIEDDQYYLYGDSLYQELSDERSSSDPEKIEIQPEVMNESVDISTLIN